MITLMSCVCSLPSVVGLDSYIGKTKYLAHLVVRFLLFPRSGMLYKYTPI